MKRQGCPHVLPPNLFKPGAGAGLQHRRAPDPLHRVHPAGLAGQRHGAIAVVRRREGGAFVTFYSPMPFRHSNCAFPSSSRENLGMVNFSPPGPRRRYLGDAEPNAGRRVHGADVRRPPEQRSHRPVRPDRKGSQATDAGSGWRRASPARQESRSPPSCKLAAGVRNRWRLATSPASPSVVVPSPNFMRKGLIDTLPCRARVHRDRLIVAVEVSDPSFITRLYNERITGVAAQAVMRRFHLPRNRTAS